MNVDRWLVPGLLALLNCACNELAESPGGAVGRRGLLHSDVPVLDGCDCGCDAARAGMDCVCPPDAKGRVYARVPRGRNRAELQADTSVCPVGGWEMVVALGVSRCVPSCTAEGMSDAEEQHMATVGLNDALALRRAVRCCNRGLGPQVSMHDSEWAAMGPEGCCFGGELTVMVRVP